MTALGDRLEPEERDTAAAAAGARTPADLLESDEPFARWAIVEVMGHRRLAGFVREVTLAGHGMIRVDVPVSPSTFASQFYGPPAVFSLTPTTEAIVRKYAPLWWPDPATAHELPAPGTFGDEDY